MRLAGWGVDGICTNVPDVAIGGAARAERRREWRQSDRPVVAQREQQVHHLWSVLEAQPARLAQVVPVDLVREGPGGLDLESGQVVVLVDRAVGLDGPAPERAGQRGEEGPGLQAAERDGHQPALEVGVGAEVEGAVAEVRVGAGVEHDGEVAVRHGRPVVGQLHREVGLRPVVLREPRPEGGVDEERVAHPPLDRGALLDLPDDRGVVADTGVEAEVAAVDHAQPDPAEVALLEGRDELLGRGDGIVGEPDAPGEHVGRAAGQHRQRGAACRRCPPRPR